jgi:hypothetical protein
MIALRDGALAHTVRRESGEARNLFDQHDAQFSGTARMKV